MKSFLQLKENLKCDFENLKSIKIAVIGDTTTQVFVQALRGTGYDRGYDLQIFESSFNQIELQVFDSESELYKHQPEIVVIFQSSHKLLEKYNNLKPDQYNKLAENQIKLINNLYTSLKERTHAKIIFYNFPEINDSVYGNYANLSELSFLFQLRKLNFDLMIYASQHSDFYICDLSSIQNLIGKAKIFQASLYFNTEIVLSIEELPLVSAYTLDIIAALNGKFKKCIILDLDNTMWGGVIGDDGLENIQIGSSGIGKAFSEFQHWLKKLKNRGIILTICSKNTESIAKSPFENHPEMILNLDDFAVFMANWENKIDNIRQIKEILNIGFDSMVFLDDNPFERNMVRENIPEITVPELPEDFADVLEYLYTLNLFETISYSSEDEDRTRQYQIEAKRTILKNSFTNEEEFLNSLNMQSRIESFNLFNTPRISQLTFRSNQFNLRTIRYTEAEIGSISNSSDFINFAFTLDDKFGDYGITCVVILKKLDERSLFIDTWLMSCRVLKRGMEKFVLNVIANYARENGYLFLIGEYIRTAKNGIVENHYQLLGFQQNNSFWRLDILNYRNKNCYINIKENDLSGKNDNLIKLEGFNILPEKIESQLTSISGVKEAVVKVHNFKENDERLVAFLNVGTEFTFTKEDITGFLALHLPSFMIPLFYQKSDGFPRLSTGEIDKSALKFEVDTADLIVNKDEKNLKPTEKIILDIWSEILKTREISITDNFFEIGGNSLIAVNVFAKIESIFNIQIRLRVFFDNPRIKDLAEIIDVLKSKQIEQKTFIKSDANTRIIKGEI